MNCFDFYLKTLSGHFSKAAKFYVHALNSTKIIKKLQKSVYNVSQKLGWRPQKLMGKNPKHLKPANDGVLQVLKTTQSVIFLKTETVST